jgi:hypothetical protein
MNADRFDGPYSNLCENPAPAVDSNDGEYSTAQVLRFNCHLCIQFFSRFFCQFSFFVSHAVHRQRRRYFPRSRNCRFSHHVVALVFRACSLYLSRHKPSGLLPCVASTGPRSLTDQTVMETPLRARSRCCVTDNPFSELRRVHLNSCSEIIQLSAEAVIIETLPRS